MYVLRRISLATVLALSATAVLAFPDAAWAADAQFTWPLTPRPYVSRPFDPPDQDWLPGHRGVDLVGLENQPVLAASDGIVVFAGPIADKHVVSIDHVGGLRTTYEPVEPSVAVGARVHRGDRIGTLDTGHPGCPATCLHWGLKRGGIYLNPIGAIHLTPIRLLPDNP